MKQPKANWASGENMLHEGCVGQWLPKSVMENQIRTWQRRIDHDRATWKPRTPNTYRNPKSLDLARSKRHSDILCWSFLVFADLCWSFLIFSDLLRQTVRPSSTTLQPPSPLPTPVTWEVVHGWTHEWTVVWIVGSIKALSAEGNKEMNGNDTSVNFRRNLGRQRLKNSKYLFCHFFCRFCCHFFCHFSFVCHFVCHFFCYFNFVCHFVCHFSPPARWGLLDFI